jgi:hypothetical protein
VRPGTAAKATSGEKLRQLQDGFGNRIHHWDYLSPRMLISFARFAVSLGLLILGIRDTNVRISLRISISSG